MIVKVVEKFENRDSALERIKQIEEQHIPVTVCINCSYYDGYEQDFSDTVYSLEYYQSIANYTKFKKE